MSAALTATLPLAANDHPSRPTFYQTRAGATAHAIKAAQRASRSGTATGVVGLDDCYQPAEGGVAYVVSVGPLDWEVSEAKGAEYARLVQAGLRAGVAGCLERARAAEVAASGMRAGSSTARMLEARARAERDQARALELKVTASAVAS